MTNEQIARAYLLQIVDYPSPARVADLVAAINAAEKRGLERVIPMIVDDCHFTHVLIAKIRAAAEKLK